MKNTPFDDAAARHWQAQRLQNVIRHGLTPLQRETLIAYYFEERTIPQIAADRGVHKSTVSRTLHRAEDKLRRFLKY